MTSISRREAVMGLAGLAVLPDLNKVEATPILDFIKEMVGYVRGAIPCTEKELSDISIHLITCRLLCYADTSAFEGSGENASELPGWEKWVKGGTLALCKMRVGNLRGAKPYKPDRQARTSSDRLLKSGHEEWNQFWERIFDRSRSRIMEQAT